MKITKKVLKGFNQLFTWLLFSLLLLAIYGKFQMIVLKKDYVSLFGYTMFQVASNSMQPVLSVDDVILVQKNTEFKVNDIISFEYENVVITHRVLDIDGDKLTVKGDSNNTIDAPIDKNVVIGKVVKIFPKLKVWKQILMDPKILLFMFLTLLFFDFAFSYKSKKTGKSTKVNKEEGTLKIKCKDVIKADELLSLTTKIDVDEINKVLSDKSVDKMNKEELIFLQKKLKYLEDDVKRKENSNLKEKELLEYTIRLDLKEIQKHLSSKIH